MQIENILKIADIEDKEFSKELFNYIRFQVEPCYEDQLLKEHIYNVDDILEQGGYAVPDALEAEFEQLQALLKANDCTYFRVTYP